MSIQDPQKQTMVARSPRRGSPGNAADEWIGLSHEVVGLDCTSWLRPTPRCVLAPGFVSSGVLPMLTDTALGWLALHAVPEDRFIVTTNLHTDIARPLRSDCVLQIRSGSVIGVDADAVIVAGQIVDLTRDEVVGFSTARFAAVPMGSRSAGEVRDEVAEGPAPGDEAEAEGGEYLPVGTDAVSRSVELRLAHQADGEATFVARAGAEIANDRGGLHGGMSAMLGQHAAWVMVGLRRPDVAFRCVEARTVYLRPVPARGADLRCRVRLLHLGGRQAVLTATLLDRAGRAAVEVGTVFARV
jgi:acyl-coenzyme A thioesterase PaaI-like protein